MNERLIKLMQYFELSPSLFADEIGVKRPAISHIISGRNKPGVDLLQKVLKRFPEVSTDWLLMGTGSMVHHSNNSHSASQVPSAKPEDESSYEDLFSYTERINKRKENQEARNSNIGEIKTEAVEKSSIKRITIYFTDGSFKDFIEDN